MEERVREVELSKLSPELCKSLGLGSCMIGGAPPIIQRNKGLCAKLEIPEGSSPALALILGYSTVPFRRGIKRRFLSDNVKN